MRIWVIPSTVRRSMRPKRAAAPMPRITSERAPAACGMDDVGVGAAGREEVLGAPATAGGVQAPLVFAVHAAPPRSSARWLARFLGARSTNSVDRLRRAWTWRRSEPSRLVVGWGRGDVIISKRSTSSQPRSIA